MKRLPPILIVADRGHFRAFRMTENQHPEKIASAELEEGNLKLSEIVTDQAGAFAVAGKPGSSSAESLPLEAELETRCFRQIAQLIPKVLEREQVSTWGFAAPKEINRTILSYLKDADKQGLKVNVPLDVVHSKPKDLISSFAEAPRWQ